MISGYNVSVRCGSKVYHVQTEDRGRSNPVIETLVYEGGRILHQEISKYDDINGDNYTEDEVKRRLDEQHLKISNEIKAGRFEDEEAFGEKYISDRSFDEVVMDFLEAEASGDSLSLELLDHSKFEPGQQATIKICARHRGTGEALADISLKLRIISAASATAAGPAVEGTTDANGEASLSFIVPVASGQAAVIVQADSAEGSDEIKLLLY